MKKNARGSFRILNYYMRDIPETPIIVFDMRVAYILESDPDREMYFELLTNILLQDCATIQAAVTGLQSRWKVSWLNFSFENMRILDIRKCEWIKSPEERYHDWKIENRKKIKIRKFPKMKMQ